MIKFYRGGAGVSLPEYQDGAIFIIERGSTTGDMYVDVENGKRLHIVPDSPIVTINKSYYNSHKTTLRPEEGRVYYIWDWESKVVDGETVYSSGYKVGDGNAYLADLPIFYSVTQEKKDFWDNKVNAYMETELDPTSPNRETLILTRTY